MMDKFKQLFRLNKENEQNLTAEEIIENAFNALGQDTIKILIGQDLVEYSDLIRQSVGEIRENVISETGFILPPIRITNNSELQENEVIFYIRNNEVEHEFLIPNETYVKEYFENIFQDIITDNIDDIFTMEYCEKYINKVQKTNSWLVWDITKQIGAYEIKIILTNILKEKKSISDIHLIFEKIDECLAENRDYYHIWNPDKISKRICKEI